MIYFTASENHKPGKVIRVIRVSHDDEDMAIQGDIYLKLDSFGRSSMTELDKALKAIQFNRGKSRLYWRSAPDIIFPIFNYVTLTSALCSMSDLNNIIYVIKKGM